MIATLFLTAAIQPQTMAQKADALIQQAVTSNKIPSLVAALVVNGKVVLQKYYGTKTLGKSQPPDGDTVYGIGSLSKALTEFGAMTLVDDGKLDLNQTAGFYLPQLPAAWKPIKVINFMTHTSGIPDGGLKGATSLYGGFNDFAAKHPLAFKPGTNQLYSNLNFAVVGALIEKISGQKYADFMQARMWGPLKMTHTGPWTTKLKGNKATGYTNVGGKVHASKGEVDVNAFGIPSGGLVSTLDDLLAWANAMLGTQVLSESGYEQMFTPLVPPGNTKPWHFTPGWQSRYANGVQILAKNGAVEGYCSMMQMVPSKGAALIMVWNLKGKGVDLWSTSAQIWQQTLGLPPPTKGS